MVDKHCNEHVDPGVGKPPRAMGILQREAELDELVRLVGMDALPSRTGSCCRPGRCPEDFLHQNAFDDRDTYTSLPKQFRLLDAILHYYEKARPALEEGVPLNRLLALEVLEDIAKAKLIAETDLGKFDALNDRISQEIDALPR